MPIQYQLIQQYMIITSTLILSSISKTENPSLPQSSPSYPHQSQQAHTIALICLKHMYEPAKSHYILHAYHNTNQHQMEQTRPFDFLYLIPTKITALSQPSLPRQYGSLELTLNSQNEWKELENGPFTRPLVECVDGEEIVLRPKVFKVGLASLKDTGSPHDDTFIQLGQKKLNGTQIMQNFALPIKNYLNNSQPQIIHDVIRSSEQQSQLTINVLSSSKDLSFSEIKALINEAQEKFKQDSKATATEVLSTQNSSFYDRNDSVKFKRTSKTHHNISTKTISPTKFERNRLYITKPARKEYDVEQKENIHECIKLIKKTAPREDSPVKIRRTSKMCRSKLIAHSFICEMEQIDVQYANPFKEGIQKGFYTLTILLQIVLMLHLMSPTSKI